MFVCVCACVFEMHSLQGGRSLMLLLCVRECFFCSSFFASHPSILAANNPLVFRLLLAGGDALTDIARGVRNLELELKAIKADVGEVKADVGNMKSQLDVVQSTVQESNLSSRQTSAFWLSKKFVLDLCISFL